jgi:hypothetical protein
VWTKEDAVLKRHDPDFFFHFGCVYHHNCIPGATVQKGAIRAFAGAFVTADAENGVDLDATEGRIILVRNPEHAVFYRTIFDARG